ncbi:MAG: tripartite tricarboxylate transporter TctB family protein [Chloroflexota bacterium]
MEDARSQQGRLVSVDRVFGIALALVSLVVLADLQASTHLVFWDESGPGPSWLPYSLAAILLILSLSLIFSRTRIDLSQLGTSPLGTAKYIFLILALALVFPFLGGLLSMGLFVVVEMIWVEKQKWLAAILAGVVAVALVWGIFVLLLGVPLPTGPLGF